MSASSNAVSERIAFPENGNARERLQHAFTVAAAALPPERWAPCEVRFADDAAEFRFDWGTLKPSLLPDERRALILCGSCLEYFSIALRHHRSLGRLEVFPELDHPAVVARVRIGRRSDRGPQDARMFAAMHAFPGPGPGHLPLVGSELVESTRTGDTVGSSGWLEFVTGDGSRQRLWELIGTAGPTTARDGGESGRRILAPLGAPGVWRAFRSRLLGSCRNLLRRRGALPITDPQAGESPRSLRSGIQAPRGKTSGAIAVIKTKTDDRLGWVTAGRILARAELESRFAGASCRVLLDELQPSQTRASLRSAVGRKGYGQVLLRYRAGMVTLAGRDEKNGVRITSRDWRPVRLEANPGGVRPLA